MCFLTGQAPVPDIDLLRRFVATRYLGVLTHVSDLPSPCFLPVDPVKSGCFSFLYFLNLMRLMTAAKWAVCFEFFWHLHDMSLDWITENTYIISPDLYLRLCRVLQALLHFVWGL